MLGAIIGDIVGSRFEWDNIKTKEFDFLTYKCSFTDDTVMSLAIAKAIMESEEDYSNLSEKAVQYMQEIGRIYPNSGYGAGFNKWINSNNPQPYNSYGNGAAMRVSACGIVAKSIYEAKILSEKVTAVTHNHPEGIKGAEATAVAIYLAKKGKSILEIRDYIDKNYYRMNFTLNSIRENYEFNETCQDTVPQAIMAFCESNSFEDAIRNAISIGGDSDTLAAITGSIAEAYYGIPTDIRKHAITFLDETLLKILIDFENKYSSKIEVIQNDISVGFDKEDNSKKINTENREKMIQTSMDIAEEDLKNTTTENDETTSQKLFSHLFEACNILRGPINQDEYKSYVIPILFFKRLSDVYDEETQVALEESGGDEEYASFPENHRFDIPKGCHWQDVREASENVGLAIVNAMNGIERANPDTLYGVFSSFDDANWTDKNKLSDERLKDLIEHMSKIKVGNENYSADVMGDSYEYLIKKFADLSKKNAGEFYTPRSIVKLMVMLLEPQAGDTVYDPACGTGGMLIEAIRHIGNSQMTYGKMYGQEKNLSTSAIARMNLFLHGARDFKITQGDTLRLPNFLNNNTLQTFDCVIANPPFGLNKWGALEFESDKYGRNIWGCPSDSSADFAWLQHMIKSMDIKKGKCAVVLPQGVLFHTGKAGEIRKQLIESDKLECVITLVGGVFYNTGVSACILLLNNNKSKEHKNKVCLIDGSLCYTRMRAQNVMETKDINTIYDLYRKYTDKKEFCKVVSINDIASKGYTLTVGNYIEKIKIKNTPPIEVRKNYMKALSNLQESERRLTNMLIEGGYIHD